MATLDRPVRYVSQENRGAYGARNTGLEHARGTYMAFFDSDDLWLPHHLGRCLEAFARHPTLDWVYGAVRMLDHVSGRVIEENTFYVGDSPARFSSLNTRLDGDLRIVEDPDAVACQLVHGFYCGLQNSVIHRRLFAGGRRFQERFRVVEDELFFIRALVADAHVAYYMEPHVLYRVHDQNSSASSTEQTDEKGAVDLPRACGRIRGSPRHHALYRFAASGAARTTEQRVLLASWLPRALAHRQAGGSVGRLQTRHVLPPARRAVVEVVCGSAGANLPRTSCEILTREFSRPRLRFQQRRSLGATRLGHSTNRSWTAEAGRVVQLA